MLDLLIEVNTSEDKKYVFCKYCAKHNKDTYILDLAFNVLQLDLKELSL